MANNYLLFSEIVPCSTDEQRTWFCEQMAHSLDDDGYECPPCHYEVDEPGIWVAAEEYGDPHRLAEIVCAWQKKFGILDPWTLEFAETCSKPRIGNFGGGAIVCYKGEPHYLHTTHWVAEKRQELEEGDCHA